MARAFLHVGLAAALVVAPTLCCKAAGLSRPTRHAHTAPVTATAPITPAHKSCCRQHARGDTPTGQPQQPAPLPAECPECVCCLDRPPAAPPERAAGESDPQPTGELLALTHAGLAGSLERPDRFAAPRPPEWGGVDVKYAQLFERHVLRC